MRQKNKILEKYNDALSNVYDVATKKKELAWKSPDVVVKLLNPFLNHNDKILDVGIGTGQSASFFYKKGCQVVGIDISKKMVEKAKTIMPKGSFYQFNIEKVKKLPEKNFDVVISSGALEFIENLDRLFNLINHNMKDGGYFCFTFEEYIPTMKTQKWRESELGRGLKNPIPKSLSFIVYRRTLAEIKEILKRNNFKFLKQIKFNAYYKSNKVPVIYRAILVRK